MSIDALLRRRMRDGVATGRDLARVGLTSVFVWPGYGNGNGYGDGNGNGYGNGNGKKGTLVKHTDYIQVGTPVVVRSYVSGVFVGKLAGGEAGSVMLTGWRWLRRWEGVGGEGAVYNLVNSKKAPTRGGPLFDEPTILQQADVMVVDEECYTRLTREAAK